MKSWAAMLLVSTIMLVVPVMAQDMGTGAGGGDTNMAILMQKIKADKKLLVANNMGLNEAEGKKFWPLYDSYQKELEQINQRLLQTIKNYADAFNAGKGMVSDGDAKRLLNEYLALEESELQLKRAYADKVGKVLPATKATRFIQIENKIRAVLRADLAMQIPLVY